MEFDYERSYGENAEAYERVIVDAMRADQSLFASAEEVLSSWRIMENVVQRWAEHSDGIRTYELGARAEDIV